MPGKKEKLLNLRVELELFNEFRESCNANNSNISSTLRCFMQCEIDKNNGVNTVKPDTSDFRNLNVDPYYLQ